MLCYFPATHMLLKGLGVLALNMHISTFRGMTPIKADRYAPKVLKLVGEGQSYREISHRLGLSKNTVLDIVKRDRAT